MTDRPLLTIEQQRNKHWIPLIDTLARNIGDEA